MQEITNEGFIVSVSIPKKLNNSTIEIHAVKRPFSVYKFHDIKRGLKGFWDPKKTLCKFTKMSQIRQTGRVRLVINLYMGECINPEAEDMEVIKGTRGRVLNPDACNGAEEYLKKYLGVDYAPQKKLP